MNEIEISDKVILISAPEIIKIPIIENNEPLIDIKELKILKYGFSPEIPNNTNYTKMRLSVFHKLVEAQALLPKGLSFCLYEAYRSISLQQLLFDTRFAKVKALYPNWSNEELFDETIKMVAPVINKDSSINIPPHSTGAAVDVYLIDEFRQAVDMGIHPEKWMDDIEGTLSQTNCSFISKEAQANRQIMSNALMAVGFVNYPTEYRHWSYGDRYWAYHQKQPCCAIYGSKD
jgi:D-alanyl-D-alanine dipeptidase